MTTTLERVREAIIRGDELPMDDITDLMVEMPIELQRGFQRLIAGIVATFHSNGGPGVEDWKGESVESHLCHAQEHAIAACNAAAKNDPSEFGGATTEDGLRHVDHAACRIVMAFAREGMGK